MFGSAFADPVFADGRCQTAEVGRLGAVVVVCGGQVQRRISGRFGLELEVGDDGAHERLVDERGTEGGAPAGVPGCLGDALAHPRGRTEDAVQAGLGNHLDDRAHALARLPEQPAFGGVELNFRGSVGLVPELVLEPLDAHRVEVAAGQHAGHDEAARTLIELGDDEERVGLWSGAEPLVAGDEIVVAGGDGEGGVRADVRSALFLRHCHAEGHCGFVRRVDAPRIKAGGGGTWHPEIGQRRIGVQGRHDSMRHRHRAGVAGFDLGEEHEPYGAFDVGSRPGMSPGIGVRFRVERVADDPVVSRVELDLVDAVAPVVVGPQHRSVDVGQAGVIDEVGAADERSDAFEFVARGTRSIVGERIPQSRIQREFVDISPRRRLVEHCMRRPRSGGVRRRCCGACDRSFRGAVGRRGHGSPHVDQVDRGIALMRASISARVRNSGPASARPTRAPPLTLLRALRPD